eukprot:4923318-Prymnesium_polylepis.1
MRCAEGVKHTLSSWGSAPQAQDRPRKAQRRDRGAVRARRTCSQAARPAVAFTCGMRSSRWLRCFS